MALEALDPLDMTAPAPLGEEIWQDYFFTFGEGMRLYAGYTQTMTGVAEQRGLDLAGRYVRLYGTYASTRERMFELFAHFWWEQYEALPELSGVEWKELLV